MRKAIDKGVSTLNKTCRLLLGVDMVAMFVVLLLQIISRFVAFIPLSWSQDMITFMLVVSVFLGGGSATEKGRQIRLEFFVDLLPKKITAVFLCLGDIVSILFLGLIVKQSWGLGIENIHLMQGGSIVAYGWYYMAVSFGCAVMMLNFVMLIVDRIEDTILGKKEAKGANA